MPLTYCSCAVAGRVVHLAPDPGRVGKYICEGCGAPEEVVLTTMDAMQEQYTKTGEGPGRVPEPLMAQATLLDLPSGLHASIATEPAIETLKGSGRSLKEIEQKQREIAESG